MNNDIEKVLYSEEGHNCPLGKAGRGRLPG